MLIRIRHPGFYRIRILALFYSKLPDPIWIRCTELKSLLKLFCFTLGVLLSAHNRHGLNVFRMGPVQYGRRYTEHCTVPVQYSTGCSPLILVGVNKDGEKAALATPTLPENLPVTLASQTECWVIICCKKGWTVFLYVCPMIFFFA